ncbi:MAG TPA: 4-alpha-glucanotransferase [Pseudomonas sp.]|nr:4-alpha-glucanotransferase [Pseudomonas sp.]
MNDRPLEALALAAGLAVDWTDANDRPQRVTPEVLRTVLEGLGYPCVSPGQIAESLRQLTQRPELPPLLTADQARPLALGAYFPAHTAYRVVLDDGRELDGQLDDQGRLPGHLPMGYQRLQIAGQELTLAVAPAHCYALQDLVGHAPPRAWGLTAQVYALRRVGDGGLGDTLALEHLVRAAAARGADALAISPLHAMFSADPGRFSPYSPSSRLFLNVLHSAPASLLGEAALQAAIRQTDLGPELRRLERLPLLDWPAATRAKQRLLRALALNFFAGPNDQASAFLAFRQAGGEALENHCRFEALHAEQALKGGPRGWQAWPAALRDPHQPAVARFAAAHEQDIRFHAFAQWLIAQGLQRTQQVARDAGMGIGLIADLAVGADGGGSQAWSRQEELLGNLSVGAPPDILNRAGQRWGVSAFSPEGLRRKGFRAFIEMLRASFAHAGAIRIDHVMGLLRLWLIPEGASPDQGAYLHYPLQDLLRLLALESWRHRALVLGEDLGTVPAGFGEQLQARRILGMRILQFEQDSSGRFKPAQAWPGTALATTTTHDLPTMAGWWLGRDLDWQWRLGLADDKHHRHALAERDRNRQALCDALRADGAVPVDTPWNTAAVVDASIAFIGHTPAPLALVPMEDLLGLEEQANIPGTLDSHPNWRRRWPGASAALLDSEAAEHRLALLEQARRRARQAAQGHE